jgi:hemoglobin
MTHAKSVPLVAALLASGLLAACASTKEKSDPEFFTSGSRDADQRAEQRVSRDQQLRGESTDTEGKSKEKPKLPLYDRLGGDGGVRTIANDFVDRALVDPRVNWNRKGVKHGGVLGVGGKSSEWTPAPDAVARIKEHVAQFIAVATGGPARYDGRDMKTVHAGMRITNAEFDASIGDLKAALDALRVPVTEQKELLAVMESTRPQITEER